MRKPVITSCRCPGSTNRMPSPLRCAEHRIKVMRGRVLAAVWMAAALSIPAAAMADGVIETGSGNLVTRDINAHGFTEIHVPGSWEVEVSQGDFGVQITVDDNVLDDVRVEVRGRALRFDMRSGALFRRVTLRAVVSMPTIEEIRVSGSGQIAASRFETPALRVAIPGSGSVRADGFQVGALDIELSGSGDVVFNASAFDIAEISISGSGDVAVRSDAAVCAGTGASLRISGSGSADLRGCTFADAEISISGSGDGLLTIGSGDLTGRISGSGSITYRGSPARVDVRTTGSGRVIKEG